MGKRQRVFGASGAKRVLPPAEALQHSHTKDGRDPNKQQGGGRSRKRRRGNGAEEEETAQHVTQTPASLFFKYNTALGPPYQVIVDTNFINFSIKCKIDIYKGMLDCLYARCVPCITDCVFAELEKLGERYRVALRLAKDSRFERLPCMHSGTYADDCICQRVQQVRFAYSFAVLPLACITALGDEDDNPNIQRIHVSSLYNGDFCSNFLHTSFLTPIPVPLLCIALCTLCPNFVQPHAQKIFPSFLQHKCYIVATCDRALKRRIRKIPGVPIMYVHNHKYSIERLPEATMGGAPSL